MVLHGAFGLVEGLACFAMFWGYVGLIEGLVHRLRDAMPTQPTVKIIATGGLAPLFRDHTNVIDTIAPHLTLDGSRIVYELNQ